MNLSVSRIKYCTWMTLLTVSFSLPTFYYYFAFCVVYISVTVLYFVNLYIVCVVYVLPFGVIKNNNII